MTAGGNVTDIAKRNISDTATTGGATKNFASDPLGGMGGMTDMHGTGSIENGTSGAGMRRNGNNWIYLPKV